MGTVDLKAENRVTFLDNLRYFFIFCVVLQHSANAYINLNWWPVADEASSLAEWLAAFFDAFTMPLLFYIAGYFATPTIQKKGAASFLRGKLKRLGIPWLICIITICPVLPLVYHYTRNNYTLSTSYWDSWLTLFKNAASLNVGIITSMNDLMMNNQFYQRYMWFLSLLLLFFFLFSLIFRLKKTWFEASNQPLPSEDHSIRSSLKLLVIIGIITSCGSFAVIGLMFLLIPGLANPEPLFTLDNVIQFRPSRIFLFVVYFGLGIISYRNKWVERGKFFGHFKTWLISLLIISILFIYARRQMLAGPEDLEKIYGPIFFLALNFLTISTLGFLSSLALRFWNTPSALDQNLASNSYYMYLSHYIFVILFQLILLSYTGIPGGLKFGIVAASSLLGGYIVGQFLIKPFPRLAGAAAFGLLAVMALVIHP